MRSRLFILLSIACLFIGCKHEDAMTPETETFYCLPGECASFATRSIASTLGNRNGTPFFIITGGFTFKKSVGESIPGEVLYEYVWPEDNIWDEFADNKEQVMNDYKSLVKGLFRAKKDQQVVKEEHLSTIFLREPITITASLPIGGIPAGENLSSLCDENYWKPKVIDNLDGFELSVSNPIALYSELQDNKCLSGISIKMPAPDKLEQEITFHVSVPIRRVLLLHWLEDLKNNPDAPMPYNDEVVEAETLLGPYFLDNGIVHFYSDNYFDN